MQSWNELIQSSYLRVKKNEANHPINYYTGIDLWDKHGGIKSGELTLLAGNHLSGCSTMAIQIALRNAEKGIPVFFMSSDLSPELFLYRCFHYLSQEELPAFEELILDATYWDAMCCKYADLLQSDSFFFLHFDEPYLHEAYIAFIEFRKKFKTGMLIIDRFKRNYSLDVNESNMLTTFMQGITQDITGSKQAALFVAPSEMEAYHPEIENFPHLNRVAFWRMCGDSIARTLVMKRNVHQWQSPNIYQPSFLSSTEAGIMNDRRCGNDSERIYLHKTHCKFYSQSSPIIKPYLNDEYPF
ncbi:MAG: hypothetical protein ACKO8Q_04405 [Bacteroidota bacterium]|jgi:hypothetical protein